MKRYLCEKNVFVDDLREMIGRPWRNNMYNQTTPAFKAGKLYPMTEGKYMNEFTDEFGTTWIATDWLLDHFRFLPDIPLIEGRNTPKRDSTAGMKIQDERLTLRGFLICAAVGFMVAVTLIALFW